MDNRALSQAKHRLLTERNKLLELKDAIEEGGINKSFVESTSELAFYDNHPGDIASESFERSKDLALEDNVKIQLKKIDDALKAIEEGKYGICDICGKEIDAERLQAAPETTQCIRCRKQQEGVQDKKSRPIEEDVIEPIPQTNKDYSGFDGEDSWERVKRWNEHAENTRAGSYYGEEEDNG